eukprot:Tbor_TRINITY_DN1686_c0_g1::TRINITY_DN1686_c0_g1_i1::g.7630::m.7630
MHDQYEEATRGELIAFIKARDETILHLTEQNGIAVQKLKQVENILMDLIEMRQSVTQDSVLETSQIRKSLHDICQVSQNSHLQKNISDINSLPLSHSNHLHNCPKPVYFSFLGVSVARASGGIGVCDVQEPASSCGLAVDDILMSASVTKEYYFKTIEDYVNMMCELPAFAEVKLEVKRESKVSGVHGSAIITVVPRIEFF